MQAIDKNDTRVTYCREPSSAILAVCTDVSTMTDVSCLMGKSSNIGKSRRQGPADAEAAAQAAPMCCFLQ